MVKAESIPKQLSASDAPDEFVASVLSVEEKDEQGRPFYHKKSDTPYIKILLELEDKRRYVLTINVPKALTGSSQLDVLFQHMSRLGLPLDTGVLVGKKFRWRKVELPGSMRGNARHYPVELVS